MSRRHYRDNVPVVTLTAGVSTSATALPVTSIAGFPAVPFLATIDVGKLSAEQVLVTAAAGSTFTATRNANGQGAFAHLAGAEVKATSDAVEFDEINLHISQSHGAHGLVGDAVDLSSPQTLTSKTIPHITASPNFVVQSDDTAPAIELGSTPAVNIGPAGAFNPHDITGGNSLTVNGPLSAVDLNLAGTLSGAGARKLVSSGTKPYAYGFEIAPSRTVQFCSTAPFTTAPGRAYEVVLENFYAFASDGSGSPTKWGVALAGANAWSYSVTEGRSATASALSPTSNILATSGRASSTGRDSAAGKTSWQGPFRLRMLVSSTFAGSNRFGVWMFVPTGSGGSVSIFPDGGLNTTIYVYDVGAAADYGV